MHEITAAERPQGRPPWRPCGPTCSPGSSRGSLAVAFVLLVVDPEGLSAARACSCCWSSRRGRGLSLNLRADDSGVTLSLLETAVVATCCCWGPPTASSRSSGGIASSTSLRRIAPMKIAFNVGEHAVGASVAATMVAVAPGTGPVGLGRVLAVGRGCSSTACSAPVRSWGCSRRLESNVLRDQLAERPLELAATTFGNASLGVIAVALWSSYPAIVWVVATPAVALYMSYSAELSHRGALRRRTGRT